MVYSSRTVKQFDCKTCAFAIFSLAVSPCDTLHRTCFSGREHYYIIHSLKVDIHLIAYSRMRIVCAHLLLVKLNYITISCILSHTHYIMRTSRSVPFAFGVLIVSPDSSSCRENKTNKIVKMTIRLSDVDQYVCVRARL